MGSGRFTGIEVEDDVNVGLLVRDAPGFCRERDLAGE